MLIVTDIIRYNYRFIYWNVTFKLENKLGKTPRKQHCYMINGLFAKC